MGSLSLSLSLIKSLNGTFCSPGILYFSFHSFFLRLYFIYFYPFKLVSSGVAQRRAVANHLQETRQTWPTVCNYTSPHFSSLLLPFCFPSSEFLNYVALQQHLGPARSPWTPIGSRCVYHGTTIIRHSIRPGLFKRGGS